MTRPAVWLLAALLLVSGSFGSESDDYFYDEGAAAEEETVSKHVPVFSSRPEKLNVMEGADVTLPCLMDKATHVIVWKSIIDGNEKTLYMADTSFLSNEDKKRFKLEPMGNKGNNLVIRDVRANEAGTYICELGANPPVSLRHTVSVKYAPMVKTTPENRVLVVKEKSPATLMCSATGHPKPTVTWTREGGLLPGGKKKMEGADLAITSVDRAHMGSYACTVDNGVGDAIVRKFQLEVTFPPAVEAATKKVHSGAGHEAQLICNVHGQPTPEVTWRMGDAVLDEARHRRQYEGAQYSLSIDEVRDSDMGRYTCTARSNLGTAVDVIELTGDPKEVMMTSPPHGQQKDSYTLRWNVESYAPILEYKVIYKVAETNSSSSKQQWDQIIIEAPPKDGSSVMYSHMHVLNNLAPATAYEAVVTARNKYGWSQEPEPAFKLYTLGTRGMAADLVGGEALGSTDRGDASSVRSGALAVAAALGALLAAL